MRPGSPEDPSVIAVLDTLPECKVVLDALENHSFPKPNFDKEDIRTFADSTGVRFRQQTRSTHYFNTDSGEPPGFIYEDTWQSAPEFRVRNDDVAFIKAAAERVLRERKITERVFNYLTKRTQAAKTIVAMLAEN